MIVYREATGDDVMQITLLHAESWRNSYRGMLSDHFLDHEVVADRRAVWAQRLGAPVAGQWVCVAEEGQSIVGFICLFAHDDAQHGVLLDNLHIRSAHQGRGLGQALMRHAARWVQATVSDSGLYLWVFAANQPARKFYERLGGQVAGEKTETNFGDQPVAAVRYVWADVTPLLALENRQE